MEWEEKDKERQRIEQQRYDAEIPFTYEPFNFAWCDVFTPFNKELIAELEKMESSASPEERRKKIIESNLETKKLLDLGRKYDEKALNELALRKSAIINPASGEVKFVYALCGKMNPYGDCPAFQQCEGESSGG